jgi:hypothetical protein
LMRRLTSGLTTALQTKARRKRCGDKQHRSALLPVTGHFYLLGMPGGALAAGSANKGRMRAKRAGLKCYEPATRQHLAGI